MLTVEWQAGSRVHAFDNWLMMIVSWTCFCAWVQRVTFFVAIHWFCSIIVLVYSKWFWFPANALKMSLDCECFLLLYPINTARFFYSEHLFATWNSNFMGVELFPRWITCLLFLRAFMLVIAFSIPSAFISFISLSLLGLMVLHFCWRLSFIFTSFTIIVCALFIPRLKNEWNSKFSVLGTDNNGKWQML